MYPPVTHWAWDSNGWLTDLGYKDFAGSGVVHVLGGTCALAGCFFIGPRLGRFGTSSEDSFSFMTISGNSPNLPPPLIFPETRLEGGRVS